MSDQDRISPFKNYTISSRQVVRTEKKISIRGVPVDPIINSLKKHHNNCIVDSSTNF